MRVPAEVTTTKDGEDWVVRVQHQYRSQARRLLAKARPPVEEIEPHRRGLGWKSDVAFYLEPVDLDNPREIEAPRERLIDALQRIGFDAGHA